MKKIYFKSIKSACFMLFACLTLSICATSCSSDEFETNLPEESKQLSKAELIELALSRIPQTRADEPYPVVMVTTHEFVSIRLKLTEAVVINWGDGETTPAIEQEYTEYTHTYSDNELAHGIFLEAANDAITDLTVYQDGLIFLDVANNTKLLSLLCANNNLDVLDLTGCPNLEVLWAGGNNLSSIDLTHLSHMESLILEDNQFTEIDLSRNLELAVLVIGDNQITNLDLTNNTALWHININGLPIQMINNLPISNTSFAVYTQLEELYIANIPFTSLDLSNSPLVRILDISGTSITQLDISNLQIENLNAKNSQLTNLIYTSTNLTPYCYYVDITGTPFDEFPIKISPLITALPYRNKPDEFGRVIQGQLYTTSSAVTPFLSYLKAKNWVVNPSTERSLRSVEPTIKEMEGYGHFSSIQVFKDRVKL